MSMMDESNTPVGSTFDAATSPLNPEATKKQKSVSTSGVGGNYGPSPVWQHFSKRFLEGTTKYSGKAVCNYCNLVIDAPSTKGTNPQKTHLKRCREYKDVIKDHTTQPLISFKGGQPLNWVFSQDKCRLLLGKMIVLCELPFSIVEKEGFVEFCNEMQPKFHVVSRSTITRDIIKLYLEEKVVLKAHLKSSTSRVCLTTDMWTSLQNLGYMVITAHYVDKEWVLRKKIINFRVLPHPHRGEVIAKAIESCLLEWDIEKIMSITLDNAKNNDLCVIDLCRRLERRDLLMMGGDYIHVRCFAHVINLVVSDGIKEVLGMVKQLRRCVKYVSSPSRLQAFKKCVVDEKLPTKRSVCIDVKTRWNSTYLMIDVAIEFEKAFEALKDRDLAFKHECDVVGEGILDREGWNKLKLLHKFLEEFYLLTKRVSVSKYATSNTYFDEVTQVKDLLMEHLGSEQKWIRDMVEKMDEKFEKYCKFESLNLILVVAMVLDPRYKLQYVEFWYSGYLKKKLELTHGSNLSEEALNQISEEVESYLERLKQLMNELYNLYKSESPLMDIDSPRIREENVANVIEKPTKRPKAKDLFRVSLKRKEYVEGINDLEKYLRDSVLDDEDGKPFDVLAWWKDKATTYHVLAMVARDVLSIPITSVASESAFSTAGQVLDPFRSSLTPTIVECLVCTQDWLRSPIPREVSIEEKLEELDEMEEVMIEQMRALNIQPTT